MAVNANIYPALLNEEPSDRFEHKLYRKQVGEILYQ